MAHVAIVFASRYGQTRKIAEHVASAAGAAGHETSLHDVTDDPSAELPAADLIIVASAMYTSQHPNVIRFATRYAAELTANNAGFLSVSLAAAQNTDASEEWTWEYVGAFVDETGWSPRRVATVAGAVDMKKYDFPTKAMVKVAAWVRGLDVSVDREYTDWAGLDREVARWWAGL